MSTAASNSDLESEVIKLSWEIKKLQAEVLHLTTPFYKQPNTIAGILTSFLLVVGVILQFQYSSIQAESAQLKRDKAEVRMQEIKAQSASLKSRQEDLRQQLQQTQTILDNMRSDALVQKANQTSEAIKGIAAEARKLASSSGDSQVRFLADKFESAAKLVSSLHEGTLKASNDRTIAQESIKALQANRPQQGPAVAFAVIGSFEDRGRGVSFYLKSRSKNFKYPVQAFYRVQDGKGIYPVTLGERVSISEARSRVQYAQKQLGIKDAYVALPAVPWKVQDFDVSK